jgi:hypothetical protein
LGISALKIFWLDAPESLNQGGLISTTLNGLPDFSGIVPSVIGAFFILLIVIIILRFDRVFRPDPAPARK